MRRALALACLSVLVGCQGGSPSRGPGQSPARSPAAGPLVVALEGKQPNFVVTLVTLQGREKLRYPLPSGFLPVSSGGNLVLLRDGQGHVRGLTADGSVRDLGTLPSSTATSPLISPDGKLWLWSADRWDQSTGIYHSIAYLGPVGEQGTAVDSSDEKSRDLRPFSWTARGPVVEHGAVGLGGYFVFYNASGPVALVEGGIGGASCCFDAGDCAFSDAAKDGSYACVSQEGHLLKIYRGAQERSIPLPQPAFKLAGAAYFNPFSSAHLVVGGSPGLGPPGEQLETDLVDLATGSLKRVGPPNSRPAPGPWAWLPDGSLLLEVPDYSAGPNPGTYVVSPGGGATLISKGQPVGLLPG